MVTASSIAARASSRRPSSARRPDWLFSDMARSGRNASGRAWASCAVDGDGFLDRGQGLLPPPQLGQADRTGCSALWRSRAGTRRGGPGRAGGRWSTASSIAARASSRRPSSARRLDWLFSDMARFGQERVGAGLGELAVDG